MNHQCQYPLEVKLKAMVLYSQKRSCRAVAEELGMCRATIGKWRATFNNRNFLKSICLKGKKGKMDESFIKLTKDFNLLQNDLKEAKLQLQVLRKVNECDSKTSIEKFLFIKKNTSLFKVSLMCKALKVDSGNYYRWLNNPFFKRVEYHTLMMREIKRIFHEHQGRYGGRRISAEMRVNGYKITQATVNCYLREAGLRVIGEKKFIMTTDSRHSFPVAENKLGQNFKVKRYNEIWVSDITYIPMGGYRDWMFLTVVIDLFDRMIIGWTISEGMKTEETTLVAFKMAVSRRPLKELSLIFHSDRGVQYACKEFTSELRKYPSIMQSMSRKGNMWDNAIAESFFSIIKNELINQNVYKTKQQVEESVFDYIENYYNKIRRHSALNNMTIDEFHESIKK